MIARPPLKPSPLPLPMSTREMDALGWGQLDVLLVSGDAYVDHPSFATALLGRWLCAHGFRTGVIAQPRWDTPEDFLRLGRPRLFAGVGAGAVDSLLAHYTAFRKKRHDDAYTPGGIAGARPNRACIVYSGLLRHAFPGIPVILGGIEASLRRASHYDFWTDKLRRSILLDSKADLLVYGMGERAILDIARRLDQPAPGSLEGIPGTAFAVPCADDQWEAQAHAAMAEEPGQTDAWASGIVELPSHEAILEDPAKLVAASLALERQVQHGGQWTFQDAGNRRVVFAPPARPLAAEDLDALYALPFTRRSHPAYGKPVPALDMVQFSITAHRGCGGGCSFCSLALHQGRRIQSRSAGSIEAEARGFARHPDWRGSITDIGGPTANMWGARCAADPSRCRRTSCLAPSLCPHFKDQQAELAHLLQRIHLLPGVKHLRVASGIRHDLAAREPDFARGLLRDFVGGQLKLAPEHQAAHVLELMRKPPFASFERFLTVFEQESDAAGKEQYVVPYLMSAFPGCTDDDMRALAAWLKAKGWRPRQVQCFIPTPGTVATAMYFAGVDEKGRPIPVARTDAERLRQHRILMPEEKEVAPPRRRSAGTGKGPRTTRRRP